MTGSLLRTLVWLAGVGQLVLCVASAAIPRALKFRENLAPLRPLPRQMFWTYARYIWATNLAMGLISALSPRSLLDRSVLASGVTGYIAAYWAARVLIQFFYFDRSDAPKGGLYTLGEVTLVGLFVGLTGVYGLALYHNVAGWPA